MQAAPTKEAHRRSAPAAPVPRKGAAGASEDGGSETGTICQRKTKESAAQPNPAKQARGAAAAARRESRSPRGRRSAPRARPPQGRGGFSRVGR